MHSKRNISFSRLRLFLGQGNKVLLVILLIPCYSVIAQIKSENFSTLNVSYFGKSITRPGIKVGSDIFSFSFKPHIRTHGDTCARKLILSSNVGFYCHFRNHYGLFLNTELGYRTTYSKGFFWQSNIGAGYLRTFLANRVYEVNDNGDLNRLFLAGNNQLMPGIGIIIGKNISKKNKELKTFYCRFGSFLQYPFNTMWLPNLILEFGTSFILK